MACDVGGFEYGMGTTTKPMADGVAGWWEGREMRANRACRGERGAEGCGVWPCSVWGRSSVECFRTNLKNGFDL